MCRQEGCPLLFVFAAQGISAVVRGIYINKYKADGMQKKYLYQMSLILIISVILNCIFYFFWPSIAAIACATFVANLIWLIICEFENPELRYNLKTIFCVAFLLFIYFFTGYKENSIAGCLIYCGAGLVLGLTLMRDSFMALFKSLMRTAIDKLHR